MQVINNDSFWNITGKSIEETKKNLLDPTLIFMLKDIHSVISNLSELPDETEVPVWYTEVLNFAASRFEFLLSSNSTPESIHAFYDKFFKGVWDEYLKNPTHRFTLTFLEVWKTQYLVNKRISEFDELSTVSDSLKDKIDKFEKSVSEKSSMADDVISKLSKASVEVGVEKFAKIFDDQAVLLKKASINWLISGFVGLAVLIGVLLGLHELLDTDDDTWSPSNIVYLASRVLLVSMLIFAVSFFFRQYRVNMHLFTLNKHRANTLKSFEYLTKSPDKLEVQSYNAILMKVAESIYQAGQTGYINGNESSHDIPSIIDMTKIVKDSQ